MNDLISRQAAIDAIENAFDRETLLTGFIRSIAVRAIKDIPSAQSEPSQVVRDIADIIENEMDMRVIARSGITDEQAIEHLQASGWMQNHDKQMYEMGLREQLADDSDSYDAILPSAQPEIIYCKKCKHWTRTCGDEQWSLGDCDVFDKHLVMCNGYCAWAERREE